MPIAATLPSLQQQMAQVAQLKITGTPALAAIIMTNAVAQTIGAGFIPGVPPIPTPPTGFQATLSQIKSAFNMGQAAEPNIVAQKIADGIKVIAPIVPPNGYPLLYNMLKNAFNLKIAGNPQLFGTIVANAIISYFSSGAVV